MMMLYSIILGALIIWRVIVPLKLSVKWKIAISGIVALVALKFYIMRLFGGELFFTPDAPGWVLLPVTWLFIVMIFFAIWVIGWEVLVLIVRAIAGVRKKKLPAVFTGVKWKLYGLVPIILLVSVGMYNGLKTPDVVEYEIVIKDLPRAVDGLKIAHLSDIHADPFSTEEKVRRIVELTNEQGADLVVITGDFVDGRIGVRGEDLEPLRKLNAPMGVFGVPGNHEYYSGYAPWVDFIRGCGVRMLENSHVI